MTSAVMGPVGPSNHVLDGVQISPTGKGKYFWGMGWRNVTYRGECSPSDAASSQITLGFLVTVIITTVIITRIV